MNTYLKILLMTLALTGASTAFAEVTASRRHVVILGAGSDEVWGQYMFTVQNSDEEPAAAMLPVMMPKEKKDWFPQEGVLPKDVKLGEGGAADIVMTQEFKPGDTFIGFTFNAPGSYGSAELTWEAPYDIAELVVMVPAKTLKLGSSDMKLLENQGFAGRSYDILEKRDLKKGEVVKVKVEGLIEGRGRYWLVGGIFGGILLLIGVIGAWRMRPREAVNGDMMVEGTVA